MRIIFLSILFAGCFSFVFAQPVQLKSFQELMIALNSGEQVRAVFHYAKCTLIRDNEIQEKIPDAVGGMNIDVYEYFAKNAIRNDKPFVVASVAKLIANPKGDKYVYNYVKVKVTEDNKVTIIAQYVNAQNLEVQMDESFYSEINDGKNDKGVFFYKSK